MSFDRRKAAGGVKMAYFREVPNSDVAQNCQDSLQIVLENNLKTGIEMFHAKIHQRRFAIELDNSLASLVGWRPNNK